MTIYVITWIAIFAPYLLSNRRSWKNFSRNYAIYVFVCMTMLLGLRHVSVGIDTEVYEEFFYRASELVNSVSDEKGYYTFNYLLSELGISFQTYNFIISCILISILVWFYNTYSKNLAFSILVFMTIGLMSMYMSGTRQSLALSFCIVAMMVVDKHRNVFAIIVSCFIVWLASTFHSSAVIGYAAIAFIVLRIRLSRTSLMLLIIIAAASLIYRDSLVNIIQTFIPAKYQKFDLNENYQINPLLIIISLLIPSFCIIFDTGVEKDGKYSCTKTWFYVFSCVNALLTIVAINSMYFSRLAFYFLHMNSILIPNMIEEQRIDTNISLMYIIIGVICILYFLISIPGGTLQIDKYFFFWQQL